MKVEISKDKIEEWCEILARVMLESPDDPELAQMWDELDQLSK